MRKQIGKQAHHHLAILEHIGHARRCAQIVFEHIVFAALFAMIGAYQIDTGNMRVNIFRHIDTDHFTTKLAIVQYLPCRDAA